MEKISLWKHQQDALRLMRGRKYFALLHRMGLGKTATVAKYLESMHDVRGGIPSTLIITPLSVMKGFKDEIRKFGGEALYHATEILSGSSEARVKALSIPGKRIFIINHEALIIPKVKQSLLKKHFDVIIADEMHRFKSPDAKRTKVLFELAKLTPFRFALTGTPTPNNLVDIYCMLYFLSPNLVGQDNFWNWRRRNFIDENANKKWANWPEWKPRLRFQEEIKTILAQNAHVVKLEDALDLPPLLKSVRHCELTPEQKKIYAELEIGFSAHLNDSHCNAKTALEASLRLRQCCSGIFVDSKTKNTKQLHSNKFELLKEVIEDIPGEQFIVWTEFVASYNHIKQLLNLMNIRWGEMIGGQNLTTRQNHIDAFQRGEIRALVANPKAGGVGVNLQAASAMIYFSRGYSLEDDMQSEARAYRGGSEQHKRILRIDLVTENTIEEDIIEALNKKFSAQELLLTWKSKYGASNGNIEGVIESDVGFVNEGANSALRTGTC